MTRAVLVAALHLALEVEERGRSRVGLFSASATRRRLIEQVVPGADVRIRLGRIGKRRGGFWHAWLHG